MSIKNTTTLNREEAEELLLRKYMENITGIRNMTNKELGDALDKFADTFTNYWVE